MVLKHSEMTHLCERINANEELLLDKAVEHARRQGYLKYTATSKEAWRLAIVGLSDALTQGIQSLFPDYEMSAQSNYTNDPITIFAIMEAQRHRSRGVSLDMFLSLMKYFREAYFELIYDNENDPITERLYINVVQRMFDRMEIAFCMKWAECSQSDLIEDLQHRNQLMADDKGRYVTIF